MNKVPYAYIKLVGHNGYLIEDLEKLTISTYFPAPMACTLYSKFIPPNSYILCPLYDKGDIQIGVTGGVHRGEYFNRAMSREIAEEIGIVPHHNKLYNIYKHLYGKQTWACYTLKLSDTYKVSIKDRGKRSEGYDDKSKKVGCIVYGTELQVKSFMEQPLYLYHSTDGIIGVIAVPYAFALQAVLSQRLRI